MLPEPEDALKHHSNKLLERIKSVIAENGGWIGFDEYMELALYSPGLGYYAAGMQKFGEDGDFITAPMMGDWFAGCLARQCMEIFAQMETEESTIIEFGAGDGLLAANLIRRLADSGQPPDRYLIVEISPELQIRQKTRIDDLDPDLGARVEWLDALPESGVSGIMIANELLDALPVKRFVIGHEGECLEAGVGDQGKLVLETGPMVPDGALPDGCDKNWTTGYQSELGLQGQAWVKGMGERLNHGAMILVDYGFSAREYYHEDRGGGTLMCHYRHHAHDDAFYYPGLQDITAHVDFSAIARAGREVGLELAGYCGQGAFLLSLGILEELQAQQSTLENDQKTWLELSAKIKKLTLPHEMGELFKVMVLTTEPMASLTGFNFQNHRNRL